MVELPNFIRFRHLSEPICGSIVRIPFADLIEGPKGVEIREATETYDVELADGKPYTSREYRLKLATRIEILLYF